MKAGFAWQLPFGADVQPQRPTRFRLWAPDQPEVALELERGEPLPMQRGDGGWFSLDADVAAGARYRYRLGSGGAVPDPASRSQPDGVDGPSCVVDPRAFAWDHPEWNGRPWHETVLYEVHAGACGGYRGVIAQLPRLAALGITAIELMPLAQAPGRRNWGYDGVLPFAPTAAYGPPEALKALVDAAHGHGLMVLLDVVYNHFGPHGNHLGRYASGFFREDLHTPWGAALDFRRNAVREFFIHNALYWIHEYRFDGLRLDAVHAISGRDWLVELARRVRDSVEPGRHVHLVLENDDNDAALLSEGFSAQWNDDAHHVLHVALTGEREGYYADYADPPAPDLARWLSEGFVYQGQPSAFRGGRPRGTPSAALPPTAFVGFLQNHDQVGNRALGERLTTLADPDALRAAMALLLLCPQVPLLFMGEEWGSKQPFLYFTDYQGELAAAVRNGRRREFARFAAFADPALREAIPDPNAAETFRDSVPDFAAITTSRRAAGQHAFTAQLLAIRQRELVPRLTGARALGASAAGPAAVTARWLLGDGQVLRLDANLGAEPVLVEAECCPRMLFALRDADEGGVEQGTLAGHALVARLGARRP
jgi:malto-oligosyltrehalose trehalohydrolase